MPNCLAPQVLQDYVESGLADADGKQHTAVHAQGGNRHLQHPAQQLRHPLRCPAAFIGGRASVEMRQMGMELTERITRGRLMMLDGGHLFPMERPEATAAAMEGALLKLAQTAAIYKTCAVFPKKENTYFLCQSAASPTGGQPADGQCIGRLSRLLALDIA